MTLTMPSRIPRIANPFPRSWGSKSFRRVVIAAVIIGGMNVCAAGWRQVVLTMTPSVDVRVLLKTPKVPPIVGDFVLLEAHHEYLPGYTNFLTKRYLCAEGQVLEATDTNVYCDGLWLHRRKPETGTGKPLDPFIWSGPVPEGAVYVGSKHPDGFDSRYLGFFGYTDLLRLEAVV
jgi:type IV secretory pathway protease TraF